MTNKNFIVAPTRQLFHSAKGTTWEKHKYIIRPTGLHW